MGKKMQVSLKSTFKNFSVKSRRIISCGLILFVTVFTVVGCTQCKNNKHSITNKGKPVLERNNGTIDMQLLADCLWKFINDNKENANLRGLDLKPDSVKGTRLKKRKDLWFIGDWTCQKYDSHFVASLNIEYTGGESILVKVYIEKSQNDKYTVTNWEVVNLF